MNMCRLEDVLDVNQHLNKMVEQTTYHADKTYDDIVSRVCTANQGALCDGSAYDLFSIALVRLQQNYLEKHPEKSLEAPTTPEQIIDRAITTSAGTMIQLPIEDAVHLIRDTAGKTIPSNEICHLLAIAIVRLARSMDVEL